MRQYNVRHAEKPILKVEGLVKRYGANTTVHGVSFTITPGKIFGLLGSNGAGKTTSFHMICGLTKASAGKIILDGKDVTRWPMHRRCKYGLGYLPQERSTFGALTVEQNLYGAMEFHGYSKRAQREECNRLLERFELKEFRKRVVGYGGSGGLSGGERRRLEVARALVSQPKVLMLDEPFAACDPDTIARIQRSIRGIASEGIAVIINDHAIGNTLKVVEYAYIIQKGRVLFHGPTMEVLCNPDAIQSYFGTEARENFDTIAKAHNIPSNELEVWRQKLASAYEEVDRRERLKDNEERQNYFASRANGARETSRRDERTSASSGKKRPLTLNRRQPSWRGAESDEAPIDPTSQSTASSGRSSLTLRRRDDEPERKTPSPRDEDYVDNRYSDKIPRLFRRPRRRR
ncbi:MAG: LPS export ABC transporter ATP-binding protein [Thermoguttaceae bacterium]|jgi:lipopolysaccharide export system ATP-binding protein